MIRQGSEFVRQSELMLPRLPNEIRVRIFAIKKNELKIPEKNREHFKESIATVISMAYDICQKDNPTQEEKDLLEVSLQILEKPEESFKLQ